MKIEVPTDRLADFCRRNRIRRLALFGSVLRDDFGPASDVDVLVEFDPDARVGLISFARIENELSELLGRKVDLNTPGFLSPYFRDEVLQEAEAVYEQAWRDHLLWDTVSTDLPPLIEALTAVVGECK